MDPVYEMLWDCKYCGTKKLLGLTHRHCPECGAEQNAEERYFPSDAEKVAVADHRYAGADRVCHHCGQASAALAKCCGGCGAPLEGARGVSRRTDQVVADGQAYGGQTAGDARAENAPAQATARESAEGARGGKRGRLLAVGCLGLVVLAALVTVLALWKQESTFEVAGHAWVREIQVEGFGPVQDSAWCDEAPAGVRVLRRASEVRSHRKVQDGEDCQTRKVDNGNGTFTEKRECSPRYRDEPIRDDKCYFEVNRWHRIRAEKTRGASVAEEPSWPTVRLAKAGSCVGCERQGARSETYTVRLTDGEGGSHECDVERGRWETFAPGGRYRGEVTVVGSVLDCESLRAP